MYVILGRHGSASILKDETNRAQGSAMGLGCKDSPRSQSWCYVSYDTLWYEAIGGAREDKVGIPWYKLWDREATFIGECSSEKVGNTPVFLFILKIPT